ncbi:hypothetical protein GS535_03605 [Saccharibacter sp. EH611]|uniref:head-tail joining protein n=1 Tax=unclassified Saccharibacter TaxID=2648722 RepID=UPI0013266C64|nr:MULTISPECIES: hypothetical protein [unclassified Saccharibacter]MXV35643.1 hypothetical protein [Saccharibacter sp. EH611]MXV65745.1 hypothetical protein [Saccharibacter sp. EH60]
MSGPLDWDGLVLGPVMETFGEPLTLFPASGGPKVPFVGIYDEGFKKVEDIPTEMGMAPAHISSSLPVIGCRSSSFPTLPQQGDHVLVRGERLVIEEVQPDSHGALHLTLNVGNASPEIFA